MVNDTDSKGNVCMLDTFTVPEGWEDKQTELETQSIVGIKVEMSLP